MADIYGSHFEYAGVSSRGYGLIIANVETERFRNTSGTITGVSLFHRGTKKRYLIDDDYSEFPVSYEVEIITDDDGCISAGDRRQIEKWLFNKPSYRKFYLDLDDDCDGETSEIIGGERKRLFMNCRFINPVKLEYNGGIVGYRATLEADSGLWWQDSITKTISIGGSGEPSEPVCSFVNGATALDPSTQLYYRSEYFSYAKDAFFQAIEAAHASGPVFYGNDDTSERLPLTRYYIDIGYGGHRVLYAYNDDGTGNRLDSNLPYVSFEYYCADEIITDINSYIVKYSTDQSFKSFYAFSDDGSGGGDGSSRLEELEEEFNELVNGNVDYSEQPLVSQNAMIAAGYSGFDGDAAKAYPIKFEIDSIDCLLTPILRDGTVLSMVDLNTYIEGYLFGSGSPSMLLESDSSGLGIIIHAKYGESTSYWDNLTQSLSEIEDEYVEIATSGSTDIATINVDTDINDFTYPKVTFTMGSRGGDVIISNNSDDSTRLTKFVGLSPNTTIIMKGDINYISGQNYIKFTGRNFPRLVDGENIFTVSGDVSSITFEFNNRRAL
ncbi:MAG: hypothetical protein J6Y20_13060 [Lachnospiraceae bacterium]|nr:hypothetical protein [Lachnospiraceae bacterium]